MMAVGGDKALIIDRTSPQPVSSLDASQSLKSITRQRPNDQDQPASEAGKEDSY
jgi:hypothetical protein